MSIVTEFFLIFNPLEGDDLESLKQVLEANEVMVVNRLHPFLLQGWAKNIDESKLLEEVFALPWVFPTDVVLIQIGDRHDSPEIWRGDRVKLDFKKYQNQFRRWPLSWQEEKVIEGAMSPYNG